MVVSKKIAWILLYLAAYIPAAFSLYYITVKNLPAALISYAIALSLYTLLVIKNMKFLSSVSFFSLLLVSLLINGITLDSSANQTSGIFSSLLEEKISMLILPLFLFFTLLNSTYWARTKQGAKKLIALVLVSISVLMGSIANPPSFYQNFVYTRINLAIIFIFGIYLFATKKKLLGSLTILLTISMLLLSASMFKEKVYNLNDQEKQAVIAYVDPIAKEMFGYYNQKDYGNFCKYCGFTLRELIKKDPMSAKRDLSGPYTRFDEPSQVIRKGGRYYVEYPVKFQKVMNLTYLTFVTESISSEPILYGFAISEKPGEYVQEGFDLERNEQE